MSKSNFPFAKTAAKTIWLCCFYFIGFSTFAQQLTIHDAETKTILPEARLEWKNQSEIIQANEQGIISFDLKIVSGDFFILCDGYSRHFGTFSLLGDSDIIRIYPLHEELQPVTITAYNSSVLPVQASAPLALIDGSDLREGFNPSLSDAINLVPGIKMEERGYGGSRRINIRGSMLRSPFAVRNIKMYWAGIPVTSPDGSSPLEMFDNGDIGQVEIIKGPAGSHYGSGNGGVILLQPVENVGMPISTNFTAGSWGLIRSQTSIDIGTDKIRLHTSYANQQTDGYRDQEANSKSNIMLDLDYRHSSKLSYHLTGIQYNGYWELPGAIKQSDIDEEGPTYAQPFSVAGDAHVERNRLWVGLKQDWKIIEKSNKLTNATSVYFTQTDKINPYGTTGYFNGYKKEDANGVGGRTEFIYSPKARRWSQVVFGGEFQAEDHHIDEWTNDEGNPGDLKYSNNTQSTATLVFISTTIEPWASATLDIGAGLAHTIYDNTGISQSEDANISLDKKLDLGAELLPRVALSQRLHANGYAYVSYSVGNSTPSLFEIIDVGSGALNAELRPEKGNNVEFGYNTILRNNVFFQVNGYHMELSNAILPQVLADDTEIFTNAGEIEMWGYETSIKVNLENEAKAQYAYLSASFNGGDFRFVDYVIEDEKDQSGKRLTGVPLAQGSVAAVIGKKNFSAKFRYYWVDKAPLKDDNSEWSQAYSLLNHSVSYSMQLGNIALEIFAGVNNVTNTRYSSFYQLNGFGGKSHNPSPERNYFGGVKVAFARDKK